MPGHVDRDRRSVRAGVRPGPRPDPRLGLLDDGGLPRRRGAAAGGVRRDPDAGASTRCCRCRIVLERNRGGSFLALGVLGAGMFGVFLFLTYYLQQTLGYSPLKTGLAFLPLTGALVITSGVASTRVLPRTGPRPLFAAGMALAAVGLALLAQLGVHASYATQVLPGLILVGAGLGLVFPPATNIATLRRQRRRRRGRLGTGQHRAAGRRLDRHRPAEHPRGERDEQLSRRHSAHRQPRHPRRRSRLHNRVLVVGRDLRRGRAHHRATGPRKTPGAGAPRAARRLNH